MHRMSRSDLETILSLAISTAPKVIKQLSRSRSIEHVEWSTREMIKHICDQVDSESRMVIQTERKPGAEVYGMGKWDVDEPSPCPLGNSW